MVFFHLPIFYNFKFFFLAWSFLRIKQVFKTWARFDLPQNDRMTIYFIKNIRDIEIYASNNKNQEPVASGFFASKPRLGNLDWIAKLISNTKPAAFQTHLPDWKEHQKITPSIKHLTDFDYNSISAFNANKNGAKIMAEAAQTNKFGKYISLIAGGVALGFTLERSRMIQKDSVLINETMSRVDSQLSDIKNVTTNYAIKKAPDISLINEIKFRIEDSTSKKK